MCDVMEMSQETLGDVVTRLRRVQGQIGGVVHMIEDGRDCKDVVTQLAAASRALDRAAYKIIVAGLAQCVEEERSGSRQAVADRDALEKLFLALA